MTATVPNQPGAGALRPRNPGKPSPAHHRIEGYVEAIAALGDDATLMDRSARALDHIERQRERTFLAALEAPSPERTNRARERLAALDRAQAQIEQILVARADRVVVRIIPEIRDCARRAIA